MADDDISIDDFLKPSPPSKLFSSKQNDDKYGLNDESNNEDNDEQDEYQGEIHEKIKEILKHASVLESCNEIEKAESLYEKALLLGPTELKVLDSFAVFLHRKKGELSRAESFFRRAVQVYVPQLMKELEIGVAKGARPPLESPNESHISESSSPLARSPLDSSRESGRKTSFSSVVRLLLNYAAFVNRGKGDVEGAFIIYRRAYRIDETNAKVLAHFAHFLAEEGGDFVNSPSKNKGKNLTTAEAERLFSLALKSNPGDPLIALWYAKLLKNDGKFAQAELMYKVAYESCMSLRKLRDKHEADLPAGVSRNSISAKGGRTLRVEAAVICNYAAFLYRVRKNVDRAKLLLFDGIERFPSHKGINKAIASLLKNCRKSLSEEDINKFDQFADDVEFTTITTTAS